MAEVVRYRKPLAEQQIARWEHLSSQQYSRMGKLRQIADLFWPAKSDIFQAMETPHVEYDRERTTRLYDATGLRARRLSAGWIQSAATNPSISWFELGFEDEDLNDDAEVTPWMTTVSDRMLKSLNTSNFYQESFQHYAQMMTFGTACTYTAQRMDLWHQARVFSLRFDTLYPGTYVIAEGPTGRVNTVMRRFWYTPMQAIEQWGKDAPERVKSIMRNSHYDPRMDEKEPYLHAVTPREQRDSSRQTPQHHPWADCYIDLTDRKLVVESGWPEFPFLVSRHEREGITAWGYGPGHEALPSAETLNKLIMMWLQGIELQTLPPLAVLNGALTGALRFAPLAENTVEALNAVTPLQIGVKPEAVIQEVARLQKEIRDAFHVDDLLALPPPDASGKMTAFEVGQRIEMMARFMGPVFTMLLSDFLDPLMDRIFGLMLRASEPFWRRRLPGVLPIIPREVVLAAQNNGGQIGVKYEGPLARAQQAGYVRGMDDLLNLLAKATEVTGKNYSDNFDWDTGLREAALALGNRRQLLLDTRKRDQARATQQQQLAMQQNAAVIREGAAAFEQGTAGLVNLQEAQAA